MFFGRGRLIINDLIFFSHWHIVDIFINSQKELFWRSMKQVGVQTDQVLGTS